MLHICTILAVVILSSRVCVVMSQGASIPYDPDSDVYYGYALLGQGKCTVEARDDRYSYDLDALLGQVKALSDADRNGYSLLDISEGKINIQVPAFKYCVDLCTSYSDCRGYETIRNGYSDLCTLIVHPSSPTGTTGTETDRYTLCFKKGETPGSSSVTSTQSSSDLSSLETSTGVCAVTGYADGEGSGYTKKDGMRHSGASCTLTNDLGDYGKDIAPQCKQLCKIWDQCAAVETSQGYCKLFTTLDVTGVMVCGEVIGLANQNGIDYVKLERYDHKTTAHPSYSYEWKSGLRYGGGNGGDSDTFSCHFKSSDYYDSWKFSETDGTGNDSDTGSEGLPPKLSAAIIFMLLIHAFV